MFVACDAKWVSIKRVSTQHIAFLWNDYQNFLGDLFQLLTISGVSDFARHIRLVYICFLLNKLCQQSSSWINCHYNNMLHNSMNLRMSNNEQTWRNMWRQRSFCASGCPAILLMKPARLLRWSWWFIHEKN